MDIPQAAIDAAIAGFYDDASSGLHARMYAALEAAAPHLNGICALHGGLDQAVILRAIHDPGSIVGVRDEGDTVSMWQTRAVVASLTAPAR